MVEKHHAVEQLLVDPERKQRGGQDPAQVLVVGLERVGGERLDHLPGFPFYPGVEAHLPVRVGSPAARVVLHDLVGDEVPPGPSPEPRNPPASCGSAGGRGIGFFPR